MDKIWSIVRSDLSVTARALQQAEHRFHGLINAGAGSIDDQPGADGASNGASMPVRPATTPVSEPA